MVSFFQTDDCIYLSRYWEKIGGRRLAEDWQEIGGGHGRGMRNKRGEARMISHREIVNDKQKEEVDDGDSKM